MDDDYRLINVWGCIADAARYLDLHHQGIANVLCGKREHAGSYRWSYLYDNVKKNGDVILGAITLGYIAKEDVGDVQNISI